MRTKATSFFSALLLLCALKINSQSCTISASVSAVPVSSPGLNYNISGSYTGGTNSWDYLTVWETGAFFSGQDSVNYTFPGSGNFTVCYYVEDSLGGQMCYDSTCIIVPVNGGGMTNCSVTFNSYAGTNGNFTFQATPIVPPGWVTTYFWNFGDGNTGNGNPVNHQYSANGGYAVALTMTSYDPNDSSQYCSNTYTDVASVTNANGGGCTIQGFISAQPDSAGSLSYMIAGGWQNGTATSYYMTINPGPTLYGQETVYYTFPAGGVYTICWSVTDSTTGTNCVSYTCDSVNVGSTSNSCGSFIATGNNGGGNYTFTATPNTPNGWAVSWYWDFGDGSNSYSNPAIHQYASNGTYQVSVYTFAYDPNDSTQWCSGTSNITLSVNGSTGGNCSAGFYSTNNGSGTYAFINTSTTTDSTYTAYAQWWVNNQPAGNSANLTYTFSGSGVQNICLEQWYIDSFLGDTCYSIYCDTVMTGGGGTSQCNSYFVLWQDSLNNTSWYGYNLSSGNNLTYLWDFGDGNTSTLQYPAHYYAATGFYLVCLTVSDSSSGCTSTYCDSAGVFHLAGPGISTLNIIPQTVSVNEISSQPEMSIFPNPVNEMTSVTISSGHSMKLTLRISTIMGQTISEEQVSVPAGRNKFPLDVSELSHGIYFLTLSNGNKIIRSVRLAK